MVIFAPTIIHEGESDGGCLSTPQIPSVFCHGHTLIFGGSSCDEDDLIIPNSVRFSSGGWLPIGFLNEYYYGGVVISGGTPPYTFSVDSESLPPGISFDGGADRPYFAGTPTAEGAYSFAISVTDNLDKKGDVTVGYRVVSSLDLTGQWTFSSTVTTAMGACTGEEGQTASEILNIAQAGSQVTISGFQNSQDNTLSGHIAGSLLTVSGSYPEENGTTTTTYSMMIYTPDRISGVERWNWESGSLSCPGSTTDVLGVRGIVAKSTPRARSYGFRRDRLALRCSTSISTIRSKSLVFNADGINGKHPLPRSLKF